MTKQLADDLIKWYLETITLIHAQPERWHIITLERCVDSGICRCALCVFDVDIYSNDWVYKFSNGWWFPCINVYMTATEVIEKSLQPRIDRLKTFAE